VLAAAVRTGGSVIADVRPDQMELPTPCPDFDVRDMIAHLVGVLDRVATIGRFGNVMAMPDRAEVVADDEWVARWTSAAHAVQEVWADDSLLDTEVQLPWTTMTGRAALAIYTNELTVHTWDLARATDQTPDWDPAAVETSMQAIRSELPDAERAAQWAEVAAQLPPGVPFDPPFADAVEVPADADPVDRLVAWNGRRP
jgi:uncharacterized protein (TIGR03086 family)